MGQKEGHLHISVSAGSIIKTLVILVLAYVLYQILDLVLVLLTAIVLASAVEPVINWFSKYKIKRLPAVLITYIFVILIFAGLFYFFVPPVLQEASNLLNDAPKYVETVTLWNPLKEAEKTVGTLALKTGISTPSVIGDLVSQISLLTTNASSNIVNIISNIFGGVFSFVLIIVLSFYLAAQESGVEKFLKIITPVKSEAYIVDLWKRSQKKIGHWLQGQLLLGVLVGVLVYLGLTILGIENALVLAVFAGVLEIIPLFGPIISAIPAVIFGIADRGLTTGLLVVGLYVIIQQFENHLIYPLVVKKVVGISPILVILSLIVGAKLAGFLGILLAAPVTSIVMEFLDDIQKDKTALSEKINHA
jgi:predicted PurR-regulated permease PerM